MAGILARLLSPVQRIAEKRAPDVVITTKDGEPYLSRWWVIPRNRFFNIYLHHFRHPDDDRALHDHPWINMSILLKGSYIEVVPDPKSMTPGVAGRHCLYLHREEGHAYLRGPRSLHRVLLYQLNRFDSEKPIYEDVWTLFITGPKVREWGFLCLRGWVHWQIFTGPGASSASGGTTAPSLGCGEEDLP